MIAFNKEEKDNIKKYIDNNCNCLIVKTTQKNNRIYNVKSMDINRFFQNKDYLDKPQEIFPYKLLFSRTVFKERLNNKQFISNRILQIESIKKQRYIINNIISKNSFENKEKNIEDMSIFYSKLKICRNIYDSIDSYFKNQRKDTQIEEEDIVKAVSGFKNIEFNETSNRKDYDNQNLIFKFLSDYVYNSEEVKDITIELIRRSQNTITKKWNSSDNVILTDVSIYEILKDKITDYKISSNDIKFSKTKYTEIYYSIITDNIYNTNGSKNQVSKKKQLENKLLKEYKELDIKVVNQNKKILTLSILKNEVDINVSSSIVFGDMYFEYTQENQLKISYLSNTNEILLFNIINKSKLRRQRDNIQYIIDVNEIELPTDEQKDEQKKIDSSINEYISF